MSRIKLPRTRKQTLDQKYTYYLASEGNVQTKNTNSFNLFASSNVVDRAWMVIAKEFLERKGNLL